MLRGGGLGRSWIFRELRSVKRTLKYGDTNSCADRENIFTVCGGGRAIRTEKPGGLKPVVSTLLFIS